MTLNTIISKGDFAEFLHSSVSKGRFYFEERGIPKTDIRIVLPKLIKENLNRFFGYPDSVFHHHNNVPYIFQGIEIVDGYEDKLIVYWVDWYNCPEILPQIFEYTENRN